MTIMVQSPKSSRGRYSPGQYDRLLSVERRADPQQLRGVTIEVAASGTSMIATERSVAGSTPRKILRSYPYIADMELPNGDFVSIEVRCYRHAEMGPEEREEPPEEQIAAERPSPQSKPERPAAALPSRQCSLLKFSGEK